MATTEEEQLQNANNLFWNVVGRTLRYVLHHRARSTSGLFNTLIHRPFKSAIKAYYNNVQEIFHVLHKFSFQLDLPYMTCAIFNSRIEQYPPLRNYYSDEIRYDYVSMHEISPTSEFPIGKVCACASFTRTCNLALHQCLPLLALHKSDITCPDQTGTAIRHVLSAASPSKNLKK